MKTIQKHYLEHFSEYSTSPQVIPMTTMKSNPFRGAETKVTAKNNIQHTHPPKQKHRTWKWLSFSIRVPPFSGSSWSFSEEYGTHQGREPPIAKPRLRLQIFNSAASLSVATCPVLMILFRSCEKRKVKDMVRKPKVLTSSSSSSSSSSSYNAKTNYTIFEFRVIIGDGGLVPWPSLQMSKTSRLHIIFPDNIFGASVFGRATFGQQELKNSNHRPHV